MRQEAPPRSFLIYSAGVCLTGVAVLAASWSRFPPGWVLELVVLFAAIVLAEALAVALPGGGSASLAYPLSVAATALFGPTAGAIGAMVSGISIEDVRQRRHPAVLLFNLGQVMLAAVVSGWLYLWAGGRTIAVDYGAVEAGLLQLSDFPRMALAALVLVAFSLLLNAVLVAVAVSLVRRVPFAKVWRASISWSIPMQGTLGLLGFAIAQILATSLVGFALFFFPLLVARQLYQRYIGLRDAYLDTVRSLVAAIEAKDPYTRGHSERVADYAVRLAAAVGLPETQIERIEFSALLHDLGKIGISSLILSKKAPLTYHELQEIRRHPDIGANILSRVPYLGDIVPAVVSHHERYDGGGYGNGLAAESVPLEARILAVADAYDAMTSVRPYRSALSHEAALCELTTGSGSQFDPDLVEKFCGVLQMPAGVSALDLDLATSDAGSSDG